MIEPSQSGTFNPLGGESCVYSTTRMNLLSIIFFTVFLYRSGLGAASVRPGGDSG